MEGKRIWMRLGVTVPLTEDELFEIMEENHLECVEALGKYAREDKMYDYDLSEEQAAKFLKRAVADGESYIPEVCFDEHIKWWKKERERRLKSNEEKL